MARQASRGKSVRGMAWRGKARHGGVGHGRQGCLSLQRVIFAGLAVMRFTT
jgi:hypothetical protein